MNPYHKLFDDRAHADDAAHLAELKDGMAVVGGQTRKMRQRSTTVNYMTAQEAAKALTLHRALRAELRAALEAEQAAS